MNKLDEKKCEDLGKQILSCSVLSGRAVLGVGLDHFDAEVVGSNAA
jgi:hypothetical protein